MPKEKNMSLSEAVNLIKDGDHVAFGGVLVQSKPMAMMWEMLKPENRRKDLTISVLTGNFGIDAMLALMNIKELNTIYCGLETAGFAPNFQRLVEEGNLKVNEFTEMQFFWAMRASELGLPYLPCKSGIDSELIDVNPYLKKHEFEGQNLVAVKALDPDVTIVHCMIGDRYGNIQNEQMKTYMDDTIARSVKKGGKCIVCVEKLVGSEYIYENRMNTILNSFEVDAVVEVPYGAHPGSVRPLYFFDMAMQMTLGSALKKPSKIERYLTKNVFPLTREQYLQKFKLKLGEWWSKK